MPKGSNIARCTTVMPSEGEHTEVHARSLDKGLSRNWTRYYAAKIGGKPGGVWGCTCRCWLSVRWAPASNGVTSYCSLYVGILLDTAEYLLDAIAYFSASKSVVAG